MDPLNIERTLDDIVDLMEDKYGLDCIEIQNGTTAVFTSEDDEPGVIYELSFSRVIE